MDLNLDEIEKALGNITQGDWTAMSLDGYPIIGVKHPPVDDSKKWQLKVISVLTTEQMKGLGKAVKIKLDDEDIANLALIANAPEWLRLLVERVRATDKVVLAAIYESDNHHHECRCYFCEAVDAYKKECL